MGFIADDLAELKTGALRAFEERVKNVHPDLCYEFDAEVSRLEAQTIQLYGIAALAAKREPDVAQVAGIWKMMVSICDEVTSRINHLCD